MNRIDQLIPYAVSAVKEYLVIDESPLEVNEAYNGYTSSFGAAILQSGLLVATAMYSDEKKQNRTKGDKPCLMNAIYRVLQLQHKFNPPQDQARLFDYVLAHANAGQQYLLQRDILDASVAIKLAIRTFKLVKPSKK